MKVLVLGGTRFIGPRVVRCLADGGHEVVVFHRGQTQAALPAAVRRILGDRADLDRHGDELRALRPAVVLDMRPIDETDAQAVMGAFRGFAGRVVALSSADVYQAYGRLIGLEEGPADPAPLDEDAPLRTTLRPYRAQASGPDDYRHRYDKIPAEREFLAHPGLPGTILRLPMVHGEGDYQHRLFEYLKRMDDGRPAILLAVAKAGWRACRTHVDNAARAIALAVTDPRAAGRVYNVADQEAHTEAGWVRRIATAAGWSGEVVALPEALVPPHLRPEERVEQPLVLDTRRIRAELGYTEALSEDEALRRTIAWERANPPAAIDPGAFDYDAEDRALRAWRSA